VTIPVDPIVTSVIQHRLLAIVEEMGEAMLRTSYSQILNSSRDFSLAVCDTKGRLIAQADHLPVHVGALPWATLAVEQRFSDVRPGDVILLNDPYHGGSHLPDLTAFVPVFDGGKRLLWTIVRAHQSDIGGATHGAYNPDATEIFQEGLRIPPIKLYEAGRTPGPIFEAACWVHARRPFFVMADLAENARRKAQGKKPAAISPLALEAVRRIDALFDIERTINGHSAERRKAVRQELSAPLVADLEAWMREQRAKLSRGNDVAKAFDYMLKRWTVFTRFLDDGRICLSNNAAERGVRGIALGRKSWLFCGSDRGGQRAAVMYSLIVTAKMNDVDPQAWLGDVLARIAEHPVQKLDELLPWNWCPLNTQARQAA